MTASVFGLSAICLFLCDVDKRFRSASFLFRHTQQFSETECANCAVTGKRCIFLASETKLEKQESPMLPVNGSPAEHMECLEVCGGSQLTARGIVIGGLDS